MQTENEMIRLELEDAAATERLGQQIGQVLLTTEGVRCILFYGELGAGKTTLTRGLVSAFPGGEDAEVSSPSFTLCNMYPTRPAVLHCDLYRIEDGGLPDEVAQGLEDEASLVLVEWAERIPVDDLPAKRLDIRFLPCKNKRLVILAPQGEGAISVLRELARIREGGN